MANWEEFNKFNAVIDKYMPARGEGETMASQTVTAVNKLIYKWFNDGDVFDNTYHMGGWCNDLSSYANWLVKWVRAFANCLYGIKYVKTEEAYSDLLMKLAERTLNEDLLSVLNKLPKHGTIYGCDGRFKFAKPDENDEDEYDDGDDEQEGDE